MLQTKLVESQGLGGARKMAVLKQFARTGGGDPRNHELGQILDDFPRKLVPRGLVEVCQAQTLGAGHAGETLRNALQKHLTQGRRSDPFPGARIPMDPFADRHSQSLRHFPARFVAAL
jgi:hypothetical protein